ncbi:MAG: hypothetical protein U9N34_03645, partial [Candidatus Cloacimonadota bacterium]|nr:hypothetical protein [Candidatus Cloacimonadota bacterium]
SLFESFGGFEVRRANIAERDQDYVLSLYRWLVLSLKKKELDQAHKSVQRLFKKVFAQRGTSGHRTAFEALLERLWRNYNSPHLYQQLSSILSFLEDELEVFFIESHSIQNNILFRVRNFTMMLENHIGDAKRLKGLVDKQNSSIEHLASNPEYFNMILDFKTHEIETKINNLELREASILSGKYAEMIKNYKECWKLLTEQDELSLFDNSRANIKSEMILLRSSVLTSNMKDNNMIANIDDKVNEISKLISHPLDISRLNNYKIMYLLRHQKEKEGFTFALSLFPTIETELLNYFDLLWFIKALNDSILFNKITKFKKYIPIVDFQFSQLDIDKKGHPIDLLWRESAMFEFLVKNDKKAALKNIKNSKSSFTLGDSAIAQWLKIVVNIHEDFFLNKLKSEGEYFNDFEKIEFIEDVGKYSEGLVGITQWVDSNKYEGYLFENPKHYTSEFIKKYDEKPTYQDAQSSATGLIYQLALEKCENLDAQEVLENLQNLDVETFYGHIKYNNIRMNVNHKMAIVQIQDGKMESIWPKDVSQKKIIYPIK